MVASIPTLRRQFRAGTALVALLACLGGTPVLADGNTGAYLAARHAAINNDISQAATYFTRALAADPANVALMEQAVLYKIADGRVSAAVPLARALVAKEPDHRIGQLLLVTEDFRQGEAQDAADRLEKHGDKAFNTVTSKLLAGWAAFDLDKHEEAQDIFASLNGQQLYRIFADYHAGLAAAANDEPEDAEKLFKSSIGDETPTARLAEAYGRFLERETRGEDAIAIYDRALERAPSDPVILMARERAEKMDEKPEPLVETGKQGAAEALYGLASAFARDEGGIRLSLVYLQLALYLNDEMEAPRLLLGNVLEAQERWEEAAETYEDFDADSPYYRSAQVGRADALSRIDKTDEALEALEKLKEVFPKDETVPIAIGDLMRRAERYEEARAAYDHAFEIIGEPKERYWSLHYARGVSNERLGNWDEAEADLKQALEFRPDQAHVLNYLGYSWIEQNRNLTEAREMIERAVELRPDDGYITDSLGWVEYRLGDYESAVQTMERAVELTPTDPVINDHFGDTLWVVGRKTEARFQWRRALSFDPDEEELRERIRRKLAVGLDVVLEEEREAEMEDAEQAVETDPAETPKDDG